MRHAKLTSGDICPECEKGKVYTQKEPKALVRVIGQAPLTATVYELERLRCNPAVAKSSPPRNRKASGPKNTTRQRQP